MLHSRSSFNCLTMIGGRHSERRHLTDMRPSTKAHNQPQIGRARSLFWCRRPQPRWLWFLFRASTACNQRLCLHWEQLLAAMFNKSRMLRFLWPSDSAYCFLAPSSMWSILATVCAEACGGSWCLLEADHALLFPPHLQWRHAGNVKEAVEWIFTQTPQIGAHALLEHKPFPLVICS